MYKRKKNLKGKGITLTENLTRRRLQIFNTAVSTLGVRKVWTNEGRILTKIDNRYIEIQTEDDIPVAPKELNSAIPLLNAEDHATGVKQ